MGKMSKRKGNAMENDIAKQLRAYFMPDIAPKLAYQMVHRTPLSGGHVERGDLIIKPPVWELFPWFIECRNREVWTWRQIWVQGKDSLVLKWFFEDAVEKCHPYDQNMTYVRHPLLLFTKAHEMVYFAAWAGEGQYLDFDFVDPLMEIQTIDKKYGYKYVVIGKFEDMLHRHHRVNSEEMQRRVNSYLGVTNEHAKDTDSG